MSGRRKLTFLLGLLLITFSSIPNYISLSQVDHDGLSEVSYIPSDYPIQTVFEGVTLSDNFWEPQRRLNAEVSIPFVGVSGTRGTVEAAIYALDTYPNPELQAQLDSYIESRKAQQRDKPTTSYSYFQIAATYYDITGDRELLDLLIPSADGIYTRALEKAPSATGETNSINFIRLYEVTHDTRYLDMAKYYLDLRGLQGEEYYQSHMPVLEQTEAVGHAVKFCDMAVSLVDVGALTGIEAYSDTAKRLWEDVVTGKMYITGGVGSTFNQEGFQKAYLLPNASAYSESCANIMFAELSYKLFLLTGDSKYVDVLERTMYNSIMSDVGVSGEEFFYANPLANTGVFERHGVYTTNCCPPRITRFFGLMPKYIYAQTDHDIYVNLYVSSESSFAVNEGNIRLSQESEMPWGGSTTITVTEAGTGSATANIKLRIPGWARNQPVPGGLYSYLGETEGETAISVNGEAVTYALDESGYVSLDRAWTTGDVITVEFPFEARKVVARPEVQADDDKIAVERGPIVYCAEWVDNDGPVLGLLVDVESELEASFETDFYGDHFAGLPYPDDSYGGVAVITGKARSGSTGTYNLAFSKPKPMELIPYYLWANRGPGQMTVWLSITEQAAIASMLPTPPDTIAAKSIVTASRSAGHTNIGGTTAGDPSMAYKALNDGLYPESREQWENIRDLAPCLHFWSMPLEEWAWVQYEFDILRKISEVEICWHDGSPALSLGAADDYELLYKASEEEEWKPVEEVSRQEIVKDDASQYWDSPETGKYTTYWASSGSRWSVVEFVPVEAKFLRLRMLRYGHDVSQWTAVTMLEWIVR